MKKVADVASFHELVVYNKSRRGTERRAADRPAQNEVYEDLPDEEER